MSFTEAFKAIPQVRARERHLVFTFYFIRFFTRERANERTTDDANARVGSRAVRDAEGETPTVHANRAVVRR